MAVHAPDQCWQPDAGTVEAALSGLRVYLREQQETEQPPEGIDPHDWHEMVWRVHEKLPTYKCQVIGTVDEEGRRFVVLNFNHFMSLEPHPDDEPGEHEDWTVTPQVYDDGGDHHWQAFWDPAEARFVRMRINGEA